MPKISCTAHSCVYNTSNCCSLSDVKVGGSGAKKACDTRCDSFMERTSGAQNSIATSACSFTDIDCAAKKCMYNKDGFCSASAVNVSGTGACCSDQTECETFHK